ncbi:helix-turn-helix domain-containing protein [Antrihabitans sp. YC2-6]|uniref:helix-turn-helix domain-containing protein n=1 Tax=Antrihabitans sp. YC2-6 TaxID=2799498 RepID=UPI0018F480A6|nr:helix-turn-helix domain-containing protein [Antrihabitans sp. YC2-6]MBJ8347250.1 helix-turn-helix domain-containing protein [Antrihabitans sp. YC2-6]
MRSRQKRVPAEDRVRAVLAILAGEVTGAEIARRYEVTEVTVSHWKAKFLDAGARSLTDRRDRPARPAATRNAECAPRTSSPNSHWPKPLCSYGSGSTARSTSTNPFADLETLRTATGMPVSRFARLAAIPERTYRRRLSRLRSGTPIKGPWPAPRVEAIEATAAKYAQAWPAWGHRKIAAMMRADGYTVSTSTEPPNRPT